MKIGDLIGEAYKIVGEYHPSEDCSSGSVAAALVTKKGKIYTGVCMDFGCGIGFCAEHAAIAEMLKHKEAEIEMIVAVEVKYPTASCGALHEREPPHQSYGTRPLSSPQQAEGYSAEIFINKVILPPCGRCRELMYQLHKSNMHTKVVITGGKVVTLKGLYPHPWKEAWEKK